VLAAFARIREARGKAWIVGGSVRDVLLGRESAGDVDAATTLLPERVRSAFPRSEPIGGRFGTVLAMWEDARIEFTTLRTESAYSDARHPDTVTFSRDPLEDLERRDLTVNALAFDPLEGVLLDPHGGALDVERRRLRAVGDARVRFREDALRALRVARFAVTLEMQLDADTRAALTEVVATAPLLALERVRVELEKMLTGRKPSDGLEILREAGLLGVWLPELQQCRGVPQNRHHAYDVYFHSLYSCDAAPADKPVVRWAALLHDIGKPATRVERAGEGTFYNHQFVGADLAAQLLDRLRFAHTFRDEVVHLVREHMFDYRTDWSDAAVRRWLRRVGSESVADLFDLRLADRIGNGTRSAAGTDLDELATRVERELASGSALGIADLAVDGRIVMEVLRVPSGRAVGEALEALLEEVLEDPARNTEAYLRSVLEQRRARMSLA
jgi:tRNA nucleotidyltransferase (CCA-adding enzyme)